MASRPQASACGALHEPGPNGPLLESEGMALIMRRLSLSRLLPTAALLLLACVAHASPVTFKFSGLVTGSHGYGNNLTDLPMGGQIAGEVSYETALTNISFLSSRGIYSDYASSSGITLQAPKGTITSKLPGSLVGLRLSTVDNHATFPASRDTFGMYEYFDSLTLSGFRSIYSISLGFELVDRLAGVNLPGALSAKDIYAGHWSIEFMDGSGLYGTASLLGNPSTIPEPSSVLLSSLALGLVLWGRQRPRRSSPSA